MHHPVSFGEATALANERIRRLAIAAGDEFEMLVDRTCEIEQGWVFFFNTADYARSGDPLSALAGNGPILVTRLGIVHQLPSSIPWQDAVKHPSSDQARD